MEEMRNVKRVEGEDGRMCINTEWGGFGDDGSLRDIQTEFDVVVDKTSINTGDNREDSGLESTQNILTKLGLKWEEVDSRVVRLFCNTISSRAARLCAAALATLANRIRVNRGLDHLKTTVGVDGKVYRKHPNFSKELQAMVRLLAPECDITFLVSEDGSGMGAAMVTAVVQRLASSSC